MNRVLRTGDRVEFRATEAADEFCRHPYLPELRGCDGGSQTWDAATDRWMTVVSRMRCNGRPAFAVKLSWTKGQVLVYASLLRLDNRARRNRIAAKVEAAKVRRRDRVQLEKDTAKARSLGIGTAERSGRKTSK